MRIGIWLLAMFSNIFITIGISQVLQLMMPLETFLLPKYSIWFLIFFAVSGGYLIGLWPEGTKEKEPFKLEH